MLGVAAVAWVAVLVLPAVVLGIPSDPGVSLLARKQSCLCRLASTGSWFQEPCG